MLECDAFYCADPCCTLFHPRQGAPVGLNEPEVIEVAPATKDEVELARCFDVALARWCCPTENATTAAQRRALKKADLTKEERRAQLGSLDQRCVQWLRRVHFALLMRVTCKTCGGGQSNLWWTVELIISLLNLKFQ